MWLKVLLRGQRSGRKFEIKGLPPGDYTIAFVHEKLGEQDQKVTLAAKDSKTVDVTSSPARK